MRNFLPAEFESEHREEKNFDSTWILFEWNFNFDDSICNLWKNEYLDIIGFGRALSDVLTE